MSTISGLVSVAGVVSLWLLWKFGVKKFCLDLFRERLFELRFEMFSMGMTGELPFDSETYRTLEVLFNGLLRYGHRVSLVTFIFSSVEQEKAKKAKEYQDFPQQMALQIARLDPAVQQKMRSVLSEVSKAIVLYMAFTSLLFLAFAALAAVAKMLGIWRPDVAKVSSVIEGEAYRTESRRPLSMVTA